VKPLIHIVEDDSAIRESLKLLLEARGYDVDAFADGDELMTRGDHARCGCLILDVNLPGDDGFGVLAKLRAKGVQTPAIFVSGRATLQMQDKARAAQALAFFAKPVAPAELLSALARATGRT